MTTKQKSSDIKSVYVATIALSILALMITVQPVGVNASSNNDNNNCAEKSVLAEIVCGVDDAVSGYNQGYNDGKRAGLNDEGSSCPQSDSTSGYCLGWNAGYDRGEQSREDVEKNQNSDDGDFVPNDNNNDNNNGGDGGDNNNDNDDGDNNN